MEDAIDDDSGREVQHRQADKEDEYDDEDLRNGTNPSASAAFLYSP